MPLDDSDRSGQPARAADRLWHAWEARLTASVSPQGVLLAFLDWSSHLLNAPGTRWALAEDAFRQMLRLQAYAWQRLASPDCPPCIAAAPQDRRFSDASWRQPPFDLMYQGFLLCQQWWHAAAVGVRGVEPANARMVDFITRQCLDQASPSNNALTSPEVLSATFASGGFNLVQGSLNFLQDAQRAAQGKPPWASSVTRSGAMSPTAPARWSTATS